MKEEQITELTPRERKLQNLRQFKKTTVPACTSIPEDLVEIVPVHISDLLTAVELLIYCNDIRSWMKDHPEWNLKEDIDDINGIAMEKVNQFRLYIEKKKKPTADIDKELTSSMNREQNRRNNLNAKRASRIAEAKTNTTNYNFISIASKVDGDHIKKITEINNREIREDEEAFPSRDIIDVVALEN